MLKRFVRFFSAPWRLSILNCIILFFAFRANSVFQIFCVPSLWASVILVCCALTVIALPFIQHPIIIFFSGISFCAFIYCFIFLEIYSFIGFLLIPYHGLGLLAYVPHLFIGQVLWKVFSKKSNPLRKKIFFLSLGLCCLVLVFSHIKYQHALGDIEKMKQSNYQELKRGFFTEKILGMHFLYHTQFCEYDGWRPPVHEPLLIANLWLTLRKDPLNISLKERIRLYKKFFPNKPVKLDCSCARQYSVSYHKDPLWKQ